MNHAQIAAIDECHERSHAGTITFPDVVGKLTQAGVESYHVDFYRGETTYYLPSGESRVIARTPPATPIAHDFSAPAVIAAIRAVQQGGIDYAEFLRRVRAAGCTGYSAYLAGRRVVYGGRTGESHTEFFPS